eukprot:Gb_31637 [translate_table: standard]
MPVYTDEGQHGLLKKSLGDGVYSREDKNLRLEGLMDGVIPSEEFMDEEFLSLMNEHKLLKDKYENHLELTRANIEQKCLLEELEKYHNFYKLGERDALLEEIQHLRTQLQSYLDSGSSPMSVRKRRLSFTPQSMQKPELCESAHSLALCMIPEASIGVPSDIKKKAIQVASMYKALQIWENALN